MRLAAPLLGFVLFGSNACSRAGVVVESVEAVDAPLGHDPAEAVPGDTGATVDTPGAPDGGEEPDRPPEEGGCRPAQGQAGGGTTGSLPDTGCPDEVPPDSGLFPGRDSADTAEPDTADTGESDTEPPPHEDTADTGETDGEPPPDEDPDTAGIADTGTPDTGTPIDTEDTSVPADALELCNGLDDDLDGEIDEDALDATLWYVDADGDGFGDPDHTVLACSQPLGFVADASDCDDTSAATHPDAQETCDGEDNDCDGTDDNDAADSMDWYPDTDGDGFGSADSVLWSCEGPPGYSTTSDDCNDSDATVAPTARETCNAVDDDCDGETDEAAVDATIAFVDLDGDGYGGELVSSGCTGIDPSLVLEGGDCDDDLAWVYPDADEFCDGIDSNCDNDLDAGAVDAPTWYPDADADGYGDPTIALSTCDAPEGWSGDGSDCADTDPARAPNVSESCNGVDDDCDGAVDDGLGVCGAPDTGEEDSGAMEDTASGGGGSVPIDTADSEDTGGGTPPDPCAGDVWYADLDGDGWGDDADMVEGCPPGAAWAEQGGDCDDSDPTVSPGDLEYCDGVDNDCDGSVDEWAEDVTIWYFDADGDGVGVGGTFERACSPSASYVADAGDCDDSDAEVFPGADEVCDGIDNDCDEGADEVSALDAESWFVDRDGDGHAGSDTRLACSQPSNGYLFPDDCDDTDSDAFPGATEVCNDIDDDCNGAVDDGTTLGAAWLYFDGDGDGYGDAGTATWSCSSIVGWVSAGTDCDDTDLSAAPGRRETCDGVDNNCDGAVDELGASGESIWYVDADADGYGDRSVTTEACSPPLGYVGDYDDCDDADGSSHPDAPEVCGDGRDNDCDGVSPVCGPWGERVMSGADAWFNGEAASDDAGRAVAFVGDVDGDGLEDWAVGVTGGDRGVTDGGSVFLFPGDASGEETAASATAQVSGQAASDFLGWAVAGAGDVDGDGLADLVVSAYGSNTSGVDAGAVYLLAGGLSGAEDVTAARLTVLGGAAADLAGYALDAGGDLDGDGVGELAIGAPYEDTAGNRAGAAYVVDGATTGTMSVTAGDAIRYGELALDRAGTAVALVGDLDGDGFGELMVGAWGDSTVGARSGAVYCEFGPVSGVASLAAADTKWLGVRTGDRAGLALSAAGDVDGDGLDDALIGAPYGTAAYLVGDDVGVLSLSTATATVAQEAASSRLGSSVSGGGDVDGDGFADVLLGAPYSSTARPNAGAAYLLRGPLSGTILVTDADGLLRGDVAQDFVGTAVSNRGDADGDGLSDVLIGGVGADAGGSSAGAAWLFLGATP